MCRVNIDLDLVDKLRVENGATPYTEWPSTKFWNTMRRIDELQKNIMLGVINELTPEDRELVQSLCKHDAGTYEQANTFRNFHITRCVSCNKKLNEYDSSD